MAGLFRVNRSFRNFLRRTGTPGNSAQKSLRAAEGLPSPFRSDSIEAREHIHLREKCKGQSGSVISTHVDPVPDREAAI